MGPPPAVRWMAPALALSLAASVAAQTPVPAASPSPAPPSPVPPAAAPAGVAAPADATPPPEPGKTPQPTCTAERPCLLAERQESLSNDHSRATGFVDLQFGDARVQADTVDLFAEEKPDGSRGNRIEAKGNVVFLRGEERLAGDRLVMDLVSGHGTFENAVGYVEPGVFVEARRIERLDAKTYRIEGGRFTSCSQPSPRWRFASGSATLKVNDRVTAKNVLFKINKFPLPLWIPYFTYPIRHDQRSSGFLFPTFGHSAQRGWSVNAGYFWAMGRSADQTFSIDRYTQFGWGFGHELRYTLRQPSRGTFRTYLFRNEVNGQASRGHTLNWNAIQLLPWKIKASVQVNESSTMLLQEQVQDALEYATQRSRYSTVSLQRSFGPTLVTLLADSTDTFFNDSVNIDFDTFERRRHLPTLQVSRSPQRIGRTKLVFGYEARAENLSLGNQDRVDSYGRYDLYPRLSFPLALSFLQITPDVAVRYTAYGVSDTDLPDLEGKEDTPTDPLGDGRILSGPPVNRRYAEANVRLVGPSFQRVFVTPGNFYSEKYKHVIEPQVIWTYRPRISVFEEIPVFDGQDVVTGTDQLAYGLQQRFYAKRPGRTGKPETHEFLNWFVGQTYYVETGASQFDPSYASSPFIGGAPAKFSPLQSRFRFRPTTRIGYAFDFEYDVKLKQLKYVNMSGSATYDRFRIDGSWFRSNRVAFNVARRFTESDTLRGGVAMGLPARLWFETSTSYDFVRHQLLQSRYQLRYNVQCCGFLVEMIDSHLNKKQGKDFRVSIELANVGSFGNSLGNNPGLSSRPYR